MTNKLILSFCIAMMTLSLSAQKLGVRFEYGLNNLQSQEQYLIGPGKSLDYMIKTTSVTPSQSIGLFSSFDFGYLFFQPEVMYTTYSSRIEIEEFSEARTRSNSNEITEKFERVDIPIYAGVKFRNIKFGTGPVFHVAENIETQITDFEHLDLSKRNISTGWQFGAGIDFNYFNLDIKYQREFNQATDHILHRGRPVGLRNAISGLRVGMAFSIGK